MGRIPALILCTLVAAGLSSACGSSPTAPATTNTAAAFVGTWQNVDASTNSLPQMVIGLQGNQVVVHAYGACFPFNCDWGQVMVPPPTNGTISVVWQLGIEVDTQSLTLSNGQLHSALHTHFVDGSGRPDYDAVDVFNRVS